jgi:hypothetical protein
MPRVAAGDEDLAGVFSSGMEGLGPLARAVLVQRSLQMQREGCLQLAVAVIVMASGSTRVGGM